jgi:hypothetical protein
MADGTTGTTGTPILGGPGVTASNTRITGSGRASALDVDAFITASLAEEPAAASVLATCDGHVSDYRSLHVSKASALANIYTTLVGAIPEGGEAVEKPFSRYIGIIENHDQFIAAAGKRGTRDRSPTPEEDNEEGEKEMHPAGKRARLDATSDSPTKPAYAWNTTLAIQVLLPVNLEKTRRLLELYTKDPKGAKADLLNQPNCPEFPDGEWKNILAGHAVNLDSVLSGYHSTSNNDEHIEILGNLEFKIPMVTPNKVVSTTGDWSVAWNKTARATIFAFPHRSKELANYGETIISLFAATHVNFHPRVIAYDRAVRRRVGSRRDLELTDYYEFLDLRTSHMDTIGAAVVHTADVREQSVPRKKTEACNRWNQGLCMLDDATCRRMHVCNICKEKGHKGPKCPTSTTS